MEAGKRGAAPGAAGGAKPEAGLNPAGRDVASGVSGLESSGKGRGRREAACRLVRDTARGGRPEG